MNNLKRLYKEWQTQWIMWRGSKNGFTLGTGERIPGPKNYPPPWRHLRSYFCAITGGCSWGPLRHDSAMDDASRFCWKCHSTWSNPLETQDDRPWRKLARVLEPIERLEWHRHERYLGRIRARRPA